VTELALYNLQVMFQSSKFHLISEPVVRRVGDVFGQKHLLKPHLWIAWPRSHNHSYQSQTLRGQPLTRHQLVPASADDSVHEDSVLGVGTCTLVACVSAASLLPALSLFLVSQEI
jgi:hypothetical protein